MSADITPKPAEAHAEAVCAEMPPPSVSFREAFWLWVRVALNSFGGPAGQIAVMHRYLVEEKRWISESRFLHALNYCMLLPGPEAQQLATYIGWLLHRTRGGMVAGTLFVLPGALAIWVLSVLYAGYQEVRLVQWIFFGLKAAVLAVVVEAVIRIGKRALKNRAMVSLAALAFIGIFFFDVPFPAIVLAAAIVGYVGGRIRPDLFSGGPGHGGKKSDPCAADGVVDHLIEAGGMSHTQPSAWRAARVAVTWLLVWSAPFALILWFQGADGVYFQLAFFFSKAAVVTFGGAYAVLAYAAQMAVDTFGWMQPHEMLDGLGMAETTPGPLIMVLQFVGYLAAFRNPGALDPLWAGTLGAAVTTWVTFAPCFLWIFLGAPYIEALRGNRNLSAALSAITAAVVGVVLNLAVWFTINTIFGKVDDVTALGMHLLVPVWTTLNLPALAIAVFAALAILRFNVSMLKTIGISAALGVVYHLILRMAA
jgi:chromate transporter